MGASALFSLEAQGSQLVISAATGEVPRILHWGASLGSTDLNELEVLGFRQVVHGGPGRSVEPSLAHEAGQGTGFPPGLTLHRGGDDWAFLLKTVSVEQRDGALIVSTEDERRTLRHRATFSIAEKTGVLSVAVELENLGAEELMLDQCATLTMPLDGQMNSALSFGGRWSGEFQTEEIDLYRGSFVRENRAGRTSHENFPAFIAKTSSTDETSGACAAFHLAWSGNSRMRIDRQPDGRTYAQLGELLFPGEMVLKPGERYEAPSVVAVWSGEGLGALSHAMQRHLRSEILDPRASEKVRPVHYNTWEAVYFDHSPEQLLALAESAAEVGAERFVLDDGWFGSRRNDQAGLGDWWISEEVYTDGLTAIADRVRDLGMEFGIWFEPEMVNPDSDLYRLHPDWVLTARDVEDVPFRNQLTLDLSKREVSDYLFTAIEKIVRELSVSYIKWDMNRDTHHPGHDGGRASMHRQTRALYALIDRLREAHPDLEIESCSSGGARTDYAILKRTDRLWTSDNNDALERQQIQRGASHFFPLRVLGSHVGPKVCHITGRTLQMELRVATAIFGHMGMEVDLRTEERQDLEVLKAGIALYKEHRGLLHAGRQHRLETDPWYIAQAVVSEDKGEALVSSVKMERDPFTHPQRLRVAGLDPDRRYRTRIVWPQSSLSLTSPSVVEAGDLLGEGSVFQGAALMNFGIQLPANFPQTAVIYHLSAVSDGEA
ncbi:alpha-galactosidase [Parvularcula sp. ZS-1/3]|uniref:alpha-galactosidase n=1 Tax=Parvularcula mediterranea TaxID=2732508 RepID=A0A7Y3RLD6_9PROT|nr:alpha-galactosidase [Parvularcula mediterranea]NNU16213.1 alpha-galactosidase [Parvularcula mediterranea]